jgi:hypothetical protein
MIYRTRSFLKCGCSRLPGSPHPNHQVPRAPLPDCRCYRLVRVASCATWKGITPSSSLIRTHAPDQIPPFAFDDAYTRVFAGSCQSLLEDGPSRHYLCNPCIGAWTHTPPRSSDALTHFFSENTGLTLRERSSAREKTPVMQLQQGA